MVDLVKFDDAHLLVLKDKTKDFLRIFSLLPCINNFKVLLLYPQNAKVAQLVERDLAKVEVAGSNPVFRSKREGTSRCF